MWEGAVEGSRKMPWREARSRRAQSPEIDRHPKRLNGLVCVFYCHSNLVWTNLVGHAT